MTAVTIDQPAPAAALREQLLAAVEAIRPTLEGCAAEAERTGSYPERGWRAMQDSGLLRARAPRSVGGHEAGPLTQLEVTEAIAAIDGAAGWTYMIGSDSLGLIGGWLPEAGLDAFLVDDRLPRAAMVAAPTGKATPVDGGYRVTGRWSYGSGSAHAEWIVGTCRSTADAGPAVLSCLFRAADVTLHDDWQVNALRGTGSQSFSVSDRFVAHEHAFDFRAPAARGGAAFRIASPGFVLAGHGGFALGVGRHAIRAATELAQTKRRGVVNPTGIAGSERFQFELGRCRIMLDAARSQLRAVVGDAWALAQDGEVRSPAVQLGLQCSVIYATEVAVEVCRTLFRYGGAGSLAVGDALEQCLRDSQAALQHGLLNADAYGSLGQVALGFDAITVR